MNKDINDDPIFNELKKFAKQSTGPEFMPAEFYEEFRNSKRSKLRSKSFMGTVIGLLVASIALPSLSYAHVLPSPIANVVVRVAHVIAAPVRALVGTSAPAPSVNVVATQTPSDTATASVATTSPTPSTVVAPTPRQVVAVTPSATPKADPAPHTAMPTPVISNLGKGEGHSENEGSKSEGAKSEGKSESGHSNSGENEGKSENSNSNKPASVQNPVSKPAVGGSKESEHKSSGKSEKGESER